MNGKGRSIDNIVIERFFRTLKYDEIYINEYQSIQDLRQRVCRSIAFYHNEMFPSSLTYDKPMKVYLTGVIRAFKNRYFGS